MNTNKIIKYIPKYSIVEKEITEKAIIDDLIYGNKFTGISFSYKTETLIQFMYYCLTYFFKNKTYAETFFNMELSQNGMTKNDASYLFKLKIMLPNLLKLIIKYLSINNSWFNFTFHGMELINLIIFFESGNNKSNGYSSLINYLLNIKYKLVNDKINNNIVYSNWFNIFIDKITDIISEQINSNMIYFEFAKDKLYNLLGFESNAKINYCQICKKFPTNSISFECGHFYCYYCYFYNSKLLLQEKDLANICFLCRKE